MKKRTLLLTIPYLALVLSAGYVVADAFWIPKAGKALAQVELPKETIEADAVSSSSAPVEPVIQTDTMYKDDKMAIQLSQERIDNTEIYFADVQLSSPTALRTYLAQNTFGRNVIETTSSMAKATNAKLAINGDYYGFRDTGFVIRNGVLYREVPGGEGNQGLVIDANGDLSTIDEKQTSARSLIGRGVMQTLTFGPTLIQNGQIQVRDGQEVGLAFAKNQRTAIAQLGPLHYLFMVSDGRTPESVGLSLYQTAQILQSKGVSYAYNLDGGGSSTMVFNGRVVNVANLGDERQVSDMVYIGE